MSVESTFGNPSEINTYPGLFPELSSFYRRQETAFDPARFELVSEGKLEPFLTTELDRQELAVYMPLLVFSGDSTRALDMYSTSYVPVNQGGNITFESGEPDTEVALIDFTRNTRERLLYSGPSFTVQDVRFIADSVVAIAGALQVDIDRVLPQLIHIYLRESRQEVYEYPDTVRANLEIFMQEKFSKQQNRNNRSF